MNLNFSSMIDEYAAPGKGSDGRLCLADAVIY